jgi:hypothetical protein
MTAVVVRLEEIYWMVAMIDDEVTQAVMTLERFCERARAPRVPHVCNHTQQVKFIQNMTALITCITVQACCSITAIIAGTVKSNRFAT